MQEIISNWPRLDRHSLLQYFSKTGTEMAILLSLLISYQSLNSLDIKPLQLFRLDLISNNPGLNLVFQWSICKGLRSLNYRANHYRTTSTCLTRHDNQLQYTRDVRYKNWEGKTKKIGNFTVYSILIQYMIIWYTLIYIEDLRFSLSKNAKNLEYYNILPHRKLNTNKW